MKSKAKTKRLDARRKSWESIGMSLKESGAYKRPGSRKK